MTTPYMSSITAASLERSFHNLSVSHHHDNSYSSSSSSSKSSGVGGSGNRTSGGGGGAGFHQNQHDLSSNPYETTYELNSHISLPHHWEQCIDLKTGELFYMNWRTGMKARDDPRTAAAGWNDSFDDYSEDEDSSNDSEDSSTEESAPSSFARMQCINYVNCDNYNSHGNVRGSVLVVAGCKICMMYFMMPKPVEDCPKCNGQLLHFDKSENASSP